MNAAWRMMAALSVLALTGCAENYSFWNPEASSGTREPSCTYCDKAQNDMLVFADPQLDWVRLTVAVESRSSPEKPALNIEIGKKITTDPRVHRDMSDADHEIWREKRDRHVAIAFDRSYFTVTTATGRRYNVDLNLPYGDPKAFVLSFEPYNLRHELSPPPGEYIDVDFPSLTFDGVRVEIPPMRFIYTFCPGAAATHGSNTRAWRLNQPPPVRPAACGPFSDWEK